MHGCSARRLRRCRPIERCIFRRFLGTTISKPWRRKSLPTRRPGLHLRGLSMGGIVAMEIIRQAPNRVERIALMDTNP